MTCIVTSHADLRTDPSYGPLKSHVINATGLAYYANKDDDLCDRMARRVSASRCTDCSSYLNLLHDPARGPEELDRLIEQLTIGETFFFRHNELFDGLRDQVIPDLLERNRDRKRLRIWSAGCSIGAEAYSVAMLLRREFGVQLAGWDVSIIGTDINRRILSRAKEGRFRDWDFRGAPAWVREECFIPEGDEWSIRPEHREWVDFRYHNLANHAVPSVLHELVALDIVLCRNVIIYFAPPIAKRIVEQFRESLVDGGWLLVGHSEPSVDLFRKFRTVNVPGAVLYQRPLPEQERETARTAAPQDVRPHLASRTARNPANDFVSPVRVGTSQTVPDPSAGVHSIRRLADAGLVKEAAARCEKYIALDPAHSIYRVYLAMLLEQLGRADEAIASLRRAIKLDPRSILAQYLLGQALQRAGRPAESAAALSRVLELVAGLDDSAPIPDADGMTAVDMRRSVQLQLEALIAT